MITPWVLVGRLAALWIVWIAGGCLSLIVVITSLLVRALLDHDDAGGFLLIALAVIGMSTAAAIWLQRVHTEQES